MCRSDSHPINLQPKGCDMALESLELCKNTISLVPKNTKETIKPVQAVN